MTDLTFVDQLGRTIRLQGYPRRIVSLVPSQTELLFSLGLGPRIVGRTKFCIHPKDQVLSCPIIGGTKNLRLEAIHDLQPDFILANKEENDRDQIEALAAHFPVWVSDIPTLDAALDMIRSVGQMTNTQTPAAYLIRAIESERADWQRQSALFSRQRAAYLIWKDPLMVAAKSTFIDALLTEAGFVNAFAHLDRYPAISPEQLSAARPDLILLSSEPFPFREKHIAAFREMVPDSAVLIVDGTYFSWYGNRMLDSFAYFRQLHSLF